MKRAFSLVELSIVLVILGLLTGGILTGQNLIRAAELRAVTTEFQAFQSAVNTFRDKYFALPGDMRNATDFWGSEIAANCAYDNTTGSTGTLTCNGNGNGRISNSLPNTTNEAFRSWQHLANAGLIEGTYTGATAGTNQWSATLDNSPNSRLGNAIWYFASENSAWSGHGYWFDGDYGNYMIIGNVNVNSTPRAGFTPEEVWNIDTKVDDGKSGFGKVMSSNWNVCTLAGTSAETDAAYDLSNSTTDCSPVFVNLF